MRRGVNTSCGPFAHSLRTSTAHCSGWASLPQDFRHLMVDRSPPCRNVSPVSRGSTGKNSLAPRSRCRWSTMRRAHSLARHGSAPPAAREDVILLTLGTGVGGAILANGQLLRGKIGRAGHLGHVTVDPDGPADICRMPGSLEDAIGDCTIVSRTGGRFKTTKALVDAAAGGDAEARRIWRRSVRLLAIAIASFVNVIDPEIVVIGGGIAKSGPALFGPLRRDLAKYRMAAGRRTCHRYAGASWRSRWCVRSRTSRNGRQIEFCGRRSAVFSLRSAGSPLNPNTNTNPNPNPNPTRLMKESPAQQFLSRSRELVDAVEAQLPAIEQVSRMVFGEHPRRAAWFTSSARATAASWSRKCGPDMARFPGSIRSSSSR